MRRAAKIRLPVLIGTLTLAAAAVVAAIAMAGTASITVGVAKDRSGPYDLSGESVTVHKGTKSFYFRVVNTAKDVRRVTLEDRSTFDTPHDFKLRWFRARKNISSAAFDAGYQFRLKPGHQRTLRAQVEGLVRHPGEMCLFGAFSAEGDPHEVYGFLYVNSTSICG